MPPSHNASVTASAPHWHTLAPTLDVSRPPQTSAPSPDTCQAGSSRYFSLQLQNYCVRYSLHSKAGDGNAASSRALAEGWPAIADAETGATVAAVQLPRPLPASRLAKSLALCSFARRVSRLALAFAGNVNCQKASSRVGPGARPTPRHSPTLALLPDRAVPPRMADSHAAIFIPTRSPRCARRTGQMGAPCPTHPRSDSHVRRSSARAFR